MEGSDRYDWEPDTQVLHDYQRRSVQAMERQAQYSTMPRLCLYYKTGSGKTITALGCVRVTGHTEAVVIAPPLTHSSWETAARAFGMTVTCMSHAKFRQLKTKLSRTTPVIADEVHMFGGYKGVGFKRLERLAHSLVAPLVIASATPNYNDVERCYIIQRLTDRRATEGGYLAFIYKHCRTDVNPWGHVPKVEGFTTYPDAASFLADLKYVEYIEDDLVYDIEDVPLDLHVPLELVAYRVDRRKERMVGSIIEMSHALILHALVTDDGELNAEVGDVLDRVMNESTTPVLVFANHTSVALAAHAHLANRGWRGAVVTGKTSAPIKQEWVNVFRSGGAEYLVGTVTLATGTDGLDKMCDTMVILDDTEDDAMRRQLIGRIMPRGHASNVEHSNRVVRVIPNPSPGV